MERVAIIGASNNEERYSNRAQKMLTQHGHQVYPVSPSGGTIDGVLVYSSVSEITDSIDTVTLYVGPKNLSPIIEDIIALKPKRIIFNPGTEDRGIMDRVESAGITTVTACTLVLLSTNQF